MTQNTYSDPGEDIELLRSAAVAAGIMAMGYFRKKLKTWSKENSSPVTEADYLVDSFLAQTLTGTRPQYGWLSEETADDLIRLQKKRIFVVDPIDGTRGFIRGDENWSICIAVVEDGRAISGVIYAPARDELYEAVMGQGAKLNGSPLIARISETKTPVIPAAEAVHSELRSAGLEYERGPSIPSLALRLVQVARGQLDVGIGRRGAQDWDIAAASIILKESGVQFEDVCAGAPTFNKEETRHGAIAAITDPSIREVIHTALKNVYGCPEKVKPAKQNSDGAN
ncbi:MAG: 3'(2'),5'-bisphosphate nucleotidase CysQ [Devosiaceae bacterium]|nr:3'(2'),5'-bisphosphate nucleotidase CysQ [Devosiaceae bacterium]